jgi:hypothetical protein
MSLLVELGAARRLNRSRRYLKSQQALRGTRQAGEARQPAGHSSFQIREPGGSRGSRGAARSLEEPLHLCSISYGGSNLGSIQTLVRRAFGLFGSEFETLLIDCPFPLSHSLSITSYVLHSSPHSALGQGRGEQRIGRTT